MQSTDRLGAVNTRSFSLLRRPRPGRSGPAPDWKELRANTELARDELLDYIKQLQNARAKNQNPVRKRAGRVQLTEEQVQASQELGREAPPPVRRKR